MKSNKGITLIALTITVIILIVVATISMDSILGDNGIIKKTIGARQKSEEKQTREQIETDILNRRNEKTYNELDENDVLKIFVKYGTVNITTVDENVTTLVKNAQTIPEIAEEITLIKIILENGIEVDMTDIYNKSLE